MIIRRINQEVARQSPYSIWNAFIDLLTMEEYHDLSEVQRVAHLAFWYDTEINNGGHMQYFANRGTYLLHETMKSLQLLSAGCQHNVLKAAAQQYQSKERVSIESVEQYVSIARNGEFESLDAACQACEPSIHKLLEEYLEQHRNDFVQIQTTIHS